MSIGLYVASANAGREAAKWLVVNIEKLKKWLFQMIKMIGWFY